MFEMINCPISLNVMKKIPVQVKKLTLRHDMNSLKNASCLYETAFNSGAEETLVGH